MRAVILSTALLGLCACGVPPEEDISSRSGYSPLDTSYFVPVDGEVRDALATSDEWAELVDSYR